MKKLNLLKIKKILSRDPNVAVAYLLGSHARGAPHPFSDVDIGIVFKDPSVLKDSLKTHVKYYTLLADDTESIADHRELDLVFLQRVPLSLQFETVNEGKIIYEADPKYEVEYKEDVADRYADLKPERDEIIRETLEVMARGY